VFLLLRPYAASSIERLIKRPSSGMRRFIMAVRSLCPACSGGAVRLTRLRSFTTLSSGLAVPHPHGTVALRQGVEQAVVSPTAI